MAVAAAQKNRELFALKKAFKVENEYPAGRRSLGDNSRFENLTVQRTNAEETRQKANADRKERYSKLDVLEDSSTSSSNASDDEQFQALANAAKNGDRGLTEGEVELAYSIYETEESDASIQESVLVLQLREDMSFLGHILKTIDCFGGQVIHLETRPAKGESTHQFDVLVKLKITECSLSRLVKNLRQAPTLAGVTLLAENSNASKNKDYWFPRHASELDNCNHLMTKYEPDLDMSHPGFSDKEYRARRKLIAEIAFAYKYGDPIPRIDYTQSENETWSKVFNTLIDLVPKHACREYQRAFEKLQEEKIFEPHCVPQLETVSNFLKRNTGFTLRPAAGLLTARDFLSSLAFRVFQSTQYIRHINSPYHTPEPDAIHELLGHIPLLADPSFAQFSQEIGLASLGASDEEIEKLSTIYWFTVEFGLCKEGDETKAYGAGLLSAYGELLHALSDKCEHRPFEPSVTAIQPYQDQEYQPIYYVARSFEDAKEKFRRWVATMSRPFEIRYDPHTQTVEVLDSVERLDAAVAQLNVELSHLTSAINKIRTSSA